VRGKKGLGVDGQSFSFQRKGRLLSRKRYPQKWRQWELSRKGGKPTLLLNEVYGRESLRLRTRPKGGSRDLAAQTEAGRSSHQRERRTYHGVLIKNERRAGLRPWRRENADALEGGTAPEVFQKGSASSKPGKVQPGEGQEDDPTKGCADRYPVG